MSSSLQDTLSIQGHISGQHDIRPEHLYTACSYAPVLNICLSPGKKRVFCKRPRNVQSLDHQPLGIVLADLRVPLRSGQVVCEINVEDRVAPTSQFTAHFQRKSVTAKVIDQDSHSSNINNRRDGINGCSPALLRLRVVVSLAHTIVNDMKLPFIADQICEIDKCAHLCLASGAKTASPWPSIFHP